MELEHDRRLTKKQFEALASEIRAIVGDKLNDHVDGDSESFLDRWNANAKPDN